MKLTSFVPAWALAAFIFISCNNKENKPPESATNEQNTTAQLREENISYSTDTVRMNGYLVYKDSAGARRPGVLVVHEWWGLNDYAKRRAKELAEMGYVAIAVDMFGNGQTAANPDEAMQLAGPFYSNAQMAKARLDAALAKLKSNPQVDTARIAAIGYCFGGSMVLNYAMMGSDIDGVVSFHGGLQGIKPTADVKAHVLVCHGAADSFIPDQDSAAFRKNLDAAQVNYEFKSYPGAKHAFTNPQATEKGKQFNLDIAYHEEADRSSWNDMKDFFGRIFR